MAQTKTDVSKLGLDFYYSNSEKVRLLAGNDPSKVYVDLVNPDNALATIADVNGKEPLILLTKNRAVITNNSGKLDVSDTTNVEVGYLHGVTSSVQTQLDGKSPTTGNANLTTVGTVTVGSWNASVIDPQYGGTGATSLDNITVGKASKDSAGNIIITTYATKTELNEAITSAVHFKGSVATVNDLNSIVEKEVGDMYNVTETGMNYAWTGSVWDAMSTVYGIFSTDSDGLMPKVTLPSGVDPGTLVFIRSDASWVAADPVLNAGSTNSTFPSSKAVWDCMIPRAVASTTGDMIYSSGSGSFSSIPIGSDTNFLSISSGVPTWVTDPVQGLGLIVGSSTGTEPTAQTNNNVYLRLLNQGNNKGTYNIKGTGIATVVSDASGNITINAPDTNTHYTAVPIFTNTDNSTTSTATTNIDTFLNIVENSAVSGSLKFTGNDGITVSATAGGVLSITNTGVRSITSGVNNGTISVNTNGTTNEVAITGLASNAYTDTHIPTKSSKSVSDTGIYDVPFISGQDSDLDFYFASDADYKLTYKPSEGVLRSFNYSTNFTGDLAEDILVNKGLKTEPGYCYSYDGKSYHKTNKRSDRYFIGINSDTAGYVLNARSSDRRLRVALAGFVLAYVDKPYKSMTPLICTKGGKLTKARFIDKLFNRIVGYYWRPELKKTWGKVEVNGRHWIKIS